MLPTKSRHQINSRRRFLRTAVAALAAPVVVPSSVLGAAQPAPSERINVGVVGLGSRGFNLLSAFLKEPDTQIVALCDVDTHHYRDNEWGRGTAYGSEAARVLVQRRYTEMGRQITQDAIDLYTDFRELIARGDLDVVVIATPDHWHALCILEALKHGKDVYCEKPVTHFFAEGQRIYREVAKRNAVFQAGSQQRSDHRFRHAVELVRNGHLGAIRKVEVGLPTGYPEPMGDPTVQEPPDHLDYDFWCGPAPKLPYMRARHHRFWRGHRAFGGGVLMDWIGHHNDIAHWGLDMDKAGPSTVEAVDWHFPDTDVYNTPQDYTIRCEYPGGVETVISNSNRGGTKWIGEDGWVFVDRGELEASDPRWTKANFETGPIKVYRSPGHVRDFLDGCKSRKQCVAPAETAHRSITPGHLGYVSNALNRPLKWDAATERILDDDEANRLLYGMPYREPWKL